MPAAEILHKKPQGSTIPISWQDYLNLEWCKNEPVFLYFFLKKEHICRLCIESQLHLWIDHYSDNEKNQHCLGGFLERAHCQVQHEEGKSEPRVAIQCTLNATQIHSKIFKKMFSSDSFHKVVGGTEHSLWEKWDTNKATSSQVQVSLQFWATEVIVLTTDVIVVG